MKMIGLMNKHPVERCEIRPFTKLGSCDDSLTLWSWMNS